MSVGIVLVVLGAAVAVGTVAVLWDRLGQAALVAVALGGMLVGAGALLVQEGVDAASWVVTLIGFGVLTPVHARVVFGPPSGNQGWLPVGLLPRRKGAEPMSDPVEPSTIAAPEPPAPEAFAPEPAAPDPFAPAPSGPVTAPAATPRPRLATGGRSRQARVVVRKLGPWSVLKISFLFYLCVMLVFLGAFMILYAILGAIGALDSLTELIRDLFADQTFEIHGDWLFTRGLAIGLALVILWTLINVFVAFLYNLLSDIVGGIEVTLSERR